MSVRSLPLLGLLVSLLAPAVRAAAPGTPASALPSASRKWSGAEYVQLGSALEMGAALPRFSDNAGAALLRRMASGENLSTCRDRQVPVQTRLQIWYPAYQGMNRVLQAYLREVVEKKAKPGKELATAQQAMLQVAAMGADLNAEFLRTLPKDASSSSKAAGVAEMNSTIASVFSGAQRAVADPAFYRGEDVSIVVGAMSSNLPRIRKAFTSEVVASTRSALEALRPRLTGNDRSRLEKMIADLR